MTMLLRAFVTLAAAAYLLCRGSLAWADEAVATKESSTETESSATVESSKSAADVSAPSDALFVGLFLGIYGEDSALHGEQKISIQQTDESYNYGPQGVFSLTAWALVPWMEHVRLGGGMRYSGEYEADRGDDGTYAFGYLFEPFAQLELVIESVPEVDLILGTRAGLHLLIPSGDFSEEIDALQDQGVDVWSVPRLGAFVAPFLGVRWPVNPLFALRSDFNFTAGRIFLIDTEDKVDGVAFSKNWYLNVMRYEFNLGVEITL